MGTDETYVLCFCDYMSEDQVASVKAASSSETLEHGDFLARPYITVHWSEFHLQDNILTAMLLYGVSFQYHSRYRVDFNHKEVQVFTVEHLEQRRIAQVRSALENPNYGPIFLDCEAEQGNLLGVWNWKSAEGKAICAELREMNGLPQLDEATDPGNFYLWSSFTDTKEVAPLDDVEEEEDENTCIVCMVNRANTIAMPCGHIVVCVVCTAKLADTPDRHKCVRCRNVITSVLCDEM
jgi:hypothetical protein